MSADDDAPGATGASAEDSGKNSNTKSTKEMFSVDDVLEVAATADLCHDPTGQPYVTVPHKGGALTFRVQSGEFRHWLRSACFAQHHQRPHGGILQGAVDLVDEMARFESRERDVFVRVGHHNGATYVDLGDNTGRAVEIDGEGYRVIVRPPVLFRRGSGMLALTEPTGGGSIYDLGDLLNVATDDLDLVVIALLGMLRPRGPYPVLEFGGEQGSAKTTSSGIVCSLFDPRTPLLVGDPKDPRDLLIRAEHSWVVGVDNLSSMTKSLADAMCRVTTGTGASVRRNYSDTDEVLFTACRPIVMNGIPELSVRPDLADRTLRVDCQFIPDGRRRTDEEVHSQFTALHPSLLGALFQATSTAIANKKEMARRVQRLPRLADVAIQAESAAQALGWEAGKAVGLMLETRSRYRARTLMNDPLATTLIAHAKRCWSTAWLSFVGTATELLEELKQHSAQPKDLPKTANQLSGRLKEIEPVLREAGVHISKSRVGHSSSRQLTIWFKDPADDADDAG